jgi:hypothetical protein
VIRHAGWPDRSGPSCCWLVGPVEDCQKFMCASVDGGRIPSPYAPRNFIVTGPNSLTVAMPSMGNVARLSLLESRLSCSTRTPPVRNTALLTAALACAVTPVLLCQLTMRCAAWRTAPILPFGASPGRLSATSRNVECSADMVSVRRVGSIGRKCNTLLPRMVPRSACPCDALRAESAAAGIGVKLDSTFARR